MIDIHCHILPGLDDGPEMIEQSLEMCRMACSDGIRTIVATPHFRPGVYQYGHDLVLKKIEELRSAVSDACIDLEIVQGADVAITPEVVDQLSKEPSLTINGTGKYFLAEFPNIAVPPNWDRFLLGIMQKGIVPVLTHPERNGYFLSKPDALMPFVHAGGLVQITAMSLTGDFGPVVREYCESLLEHDLVHIIASDAHSPGYRAPILSAAHKRAVELVGGERAESLVRMTPQAVIDGCRVDIPPPIERRKKRRWFHLLTR